MKTKGLRLRDNDNGMVRVELPEIFGEIDNGGQFYWSILFVYVTGHLGEGMSISSFEQQVNKSERGYILNWKELNELVVKFYDVMEIVIIACKDKDCLIRYENDEEMYENCDIVIEMFDSTFWEIFSKNSNLIDRLASKFEEVEFLESDFQSKQYSSNKDQVADLKPHQHLFQKKSSKSMRTRGIAEPLD